jgi:hypothetical protein
MRLRMAFCVLLVLGMSSCNDSAPEGSDGNATEAALRAPRSTITSILQDPEKFEGQTVRVDGIVENVLGPRALVLSSGGLIGERTMLVLTDAPAAPLGLPLVRGEHAVAIGTVRTNAERATYERDLARPLEPEVADAIDSRPVLVAHRIGRVGPHATDWTHHSRNRTWHVSS